MKGLCSIFIIILLTLAGLQSNAQYSKKQVDSLLDIANLENNLDPGVKKALAAYKASKTIGYREGEVRALLIRAVKYCDAKHFEDAFRCAVEADNITEALGNPRYISVVLGVKGVCYSNLGFYKDGEKTLLDAIAIAQQMKDPDRRHERLGFLYSGLLQNIQLSKGDVKNIQLSKDDIKKFTLYSRKSYLEYKQIKDLKKFPYSGTFPDYNYGDNFMTLKQYDSAAFYFKKAVILCKANKDDMVLGFTYGGLGKYYYQQKNYKASEANYQASIKLLAPLNIGNDLKDAYVGLSKVYVALHQTANAQKYLERSVELSDSLASVEKTAIKTPLNYIIKYKEQQVAANRKTSFFFIILTSFIVAVIAVAGYSHYRSTRKRLRSKRDQISELKKRIELDEDKRSLAKVEELKIVVQLAVNNNPAFLTKFNEFDKQFSKKLLSMASSLVSGEIEFCALLRLNFETKEIARYTKASVRAVEGKKYRIRKKLNIPSDQDINVWMANV